MKNNYSNLRNTYKNTNLNLLVGDATEFAFVQTQNGGNNKSAMMFRAQDGGGGQQPKTSSAQCSDWNLLYGNIYKYDNGDGGAYAECTNVTSDDGAGHSHQVPLILCRSEDRYGLGGDVECCPLTTGQSPDTGSASLMFYDSTREDGKQLYCAPPDQGNLAYWPISSPEGGHDCKNEGAPGCKKAGTGVCSLDLTKTCSTSQQEALGCFPGKGGNAACEQVYRCDEEGGWTWNTSHTSCNAYKCTKDGGPPGDPNNNNDSRYTYVPPPGGVGPGQTLTGSCYRKPPDPYTHESQWQQCSKNAWGYCSDTPSGNPSDPPSTATDSSGWAYRNAWAQQGWTVQNCDLQKKCYLNVLNDSNVKNGKSDITYYNLAQSTTYDQYMQPVYTVSYSNSNDVPDVLNLNPGYLT